MTTAPLNILMIETHPGTGSAAARDLTEAGHRLHYCHDSSDRGFGCRGLDHPSACPIEQHVDVAFLARDGGSPEPSAFEDGVRCAIRAQVPLVEAGPQALDPYAPWVAERVDPGVDLDAACRRAAGQAYDELEDHVQARMASLLGVAGVNPSDVRFEFEPHGAALGITVILPVEVSGSVRESMAVRVLDAIRADGRTFGRVDVAVTIRA